MAEELREHAALLRDGLREAVWGRRHNQYLPYTLQIDLEPQGAREGAGRGITGLLCLDRPGKVELVGAFGRGRIIVQVVDVRTAGVIASRIDDAAYAAALPLVTSIGRYEPKVEVPSGCRLHRARLVGCRSTEQRVAAVFERRMAALGVRAHEVERESGMRCYVLECTPQRARSIGAGDMREALFSLVPEHTTTH